MEIRVCKLVALTSDADDQIEYYNGSSDDSDYAFGGVTISIDF